MSPPQHPAEPSPYGYGDQSWHGHGHQPPPPRRGRGIALPLLIVVGVLVASIGAGFAYTQFFGEDRPERADTVAGGESADTAQAEAPEGNGDTLTKKQVNAALLTVEDMPSGWSVNTEDDGGDTTDKTEPASCEGIFNQLDDAADPVAKGEVRFTQGLQAFEENISSYEEDISGAVTRAKDAFSQCPSFTSIDQEGTRMKAKVSALSFPNLGDRTLAIRMNASAEGFNLVFDVIMIAIGHYGVTLIAGGLTPVSGDDLEAVATKAIAKLG